MQIDGDDVAYGTGNCITASEHTTIPSAAANRYDPFRVWHSVVRA